jgi:predicted RNase H-like nuclease (RuvC/YqgF family)
MPCLRPFAKEVRPRAAYYGGADKGKDGGEIQKSISELQFVLNRIRRLHEESRLLNREIDEYQKELDRLSCLADAVSV